MFKLGFSLLFAVLFTCNCYPTSEELSEAPTGDTIEHEIVYVKDVKTPSEGSIDNHEDHDEYSIKDNIDVSMNKYESEEGEPMSTDDLDETDTDKKGDEGGDYTEGTNTTRSRPRRGTYRCGRSTYNSFFSMCCDGKIVSRSGQRPACCGTSKYDAYYSKCCGGKIVSRSGHRPACCGTRGYDAYYSMCCGGKIVSRSGQRLACCGTSKYDAYYSMCCGGKIVSRSGQRPACCGTSKYDAYYSMCCGGKIVSRSGQRPACCGTRGYDAYYYKCCSGQVRSRC